MDRRRLDETRAGGGGGGVLLRGGREADGAWMGAEEEDKGRKAKEGRSVAGAVVAVEHSSVRGRRLTGRERVAIGDDQ